MELGNVFLILGLLSVLPGIYFMTKIVNYLSARGEKVSFFLLRLKWFHYMFRYRQLTIEETGETGPFLRGYITAMLMALVFIIAGALFLS